MGEAKLIQPSSYKVNMGNMLANSWSFMHPADTEKN